MLSMECKTKAWTDGFNKRKLQAMNNHGVCALRVNYRTTLKKKGKARRKCKHVEIKCGCCNNKLIVCDGALAGASEIEIGGVLGTLEDWRAVLLPLLGVPIEKG